MKRVVLYLWFALSFLSLNLRAQKQECGTIATPANIAAVKKAKDLLGTMRLEAASLPLLVPVQIQFVRKSNGFTKGNYDAIRREINTINTLFAATKIVLYECDVVKYIDDDWAYNNVSFANVTVTNNIARNHRVSGVLNIFYYDSIPDACGWAAMPGSTVDWIVMSHTCVNGTTLAHELGHYFGLDHTHSKDYGAEKVSRTAGNCYNCKTAGDLLCDTPADPELTNANVSNGGLTYTGTARDDCGLTYAPDLRNLMSYNPYKSVRNSFTPEQINTMVAVRLSTRNNYNCPNLCWASASYTGDVGNYKITRTGNTIRSTVYIMAGQRPTEYYAANSIQLRRGFQAIPGSVFIARIQPCPGSARLEEAEVSNETPAGEEELNLPIHPNPISFGIVYFGRIVGGYSLFNSTGQLVQEGTNSDQIAIDGLRKGIYYLRLDEQVEKLVVE